MLRAELSFLFEFAYVYLFRLLFHFQVFPHLILLPISLVHFLNAEWKFHLVALVQNFCCGCCSRAFAFKFVWICCCNCFSCCCRCRWGPLHGIKRCNTRHKVCLHIWRSAQGLGIRCKKTFAFLAAAAAAFCHINSSPNGAKKGGWSRGGAWASWSCFEWSSSICFCSIIAKFFSKLFCLLCEKELRRVVFATSSSRCSMPKKGRKNWSQLELCIDIWNVACATWKQLATNCV